MEGQTWVRCEAEGLVQRYAKMGWISPQQREVLLQLVDDGQADFALRRLYEVSVLPPS